MRWFRLTGMSLTEWVLGRWHQSRRCRRLGHLLPEITDLRAMHHSWTLCRECGAFFYARHVLGIPRWVRMANRWHKRTAAGMNAGPLVRYCEHEYAADYDEGWTPGERVIIAL